jgi:hypothetical protein
MDTDTKALQRTDGLPEGPAKRTGQNLCVFVCIRGL